jgi:hypothetical protein
MWFTPMIRYHGWLSFRAALQPSPIDFLRDDTQPSADTIFFNTFNNVWSTNYPMWQLENAQRFRFRLAFRSARTGDEAVDGVLGRADD